MTFEVGKTYRTKGGWDAKIDSRNGDACYCAVHNRSGKEFALWHKMDGTTDTIQEDYKGYEFTLIDPDEPDYETRLRDDVAKEVFANLFSNVTLIDKETGKLPTAKALAEHSYFAAEMFMLERNKEKKRMEQNDQ